MVLLRTRQISHSSSSAPSSPRVGDLAEPGSDGPGFAGDPFVPFRRRSSRNATIATAATGIAMPRTIPSGNGAVGGVESPRERCPMKNSAMFGASRSFRGKEAKVQIRSNGGKKEEGVIPEDERMPVFGKGPGQDVYHGLL